ncbi:SH3 domain-containing protein [Pseudodonghicola flavimaris]|uniref:SH3 domain-containing protein n=1 Tax=Pseudodonghicola flavimaris TaxID=3050036 RepID=A0ABT7F3Q7_9RHOB|nr:SH3 domain-containing protein [Pseudodonghicola flavimaris]MDK3019236.1 SH3 domain-containing protein [Pseudodonghicola flavimaris]
MRGTILMSLAAAGLALTLGAQPAAAAWRDRYEVFGVEEGDMLKMRAGPGTGFVVIVGLPNGTGLRVHSCEQTGGTRWCKVSLERAHGLQGYVSWAYLRKK